ncbi:MAG: DUF4118 domain-containing protein [Oscillospiraceae bacterium]|nr:DUF4118 domain-containing protein [Oscillospiraceae bacterium]
MKDRRPKSITARERLADALKTAGLLLCAYGLCELLRNGAADASNYASLVFVLAVFLSARFTRGYWCGIAASVIGVLMVNFVFTYPYYRFNFTLTGYPLTILCMLAVSITTSALMTRTKQSEELRLEAEKEKMRGNLLRAVSHDLRTPLTSILGAASAVIENDAALTSEQRVTLLTGAQEDAQWLIRMVENLLAVTRIDTQGAAKIQKSPEPAEEVAADAVAKFKKRFSEDQIEVCVPDEYLLVPMDPILIEQVLQNLLENAVIHGKGDHIRLCVTREADHALFEVRDNGCGIDPTRLAHIFDGSSMGGDGTQADNKRNMGIGLSVCNAIIQAHGGVLRAFNAQDGGAVFQFELALEES